MPAKKLYADEQLVERAREQRRRWAEKNALPLTPETAERVRDLFPSRGEGCWEWTGGRNPSGYGRVQLGSNWYLAHRVAWVLANGSIPEGMFICHHCDNPPCVRPDHLFVGTAKDNSHDMAAKGRGCSGEKAIYRRYPHLVPRGDNHPQRRRPEIVLRGEQRPWAKYTREKVLEVRRLFHEDKVSRKDIAARLGIPYNTVVGMILGRRWAHLLEVSHTES